MIQSARARSSSNPMIAVTSPWRRRVAAAALAALAVSAGWACTPPGAGEDGSRAETIERSLAGPNGIAINGIAINGIAINGIAINGIAINGIAINGVTISGAELDPEQAEAFEHVLSYLVECALPAGDSITTRAAGGQLRVHAGMFGLAPEWKSRPLTPGSERRLSACLAARSNLLGRTVSISLRHPQVETTELEAALYTTHEGAFWGSLFSSEPAIQVCRAQGAGLSGRMCAESDDCGFTFAGDCADVCDSYDPVDGYSRCGAEGATEVVNTFLSLGSRLTFGGRNVCSIGEDRTLSCQGDDRHGQLGDGAGSAASQPGSVSVRGLDGEVAEAAVHDHACARLRDGTLWCWGQNDSGQVGDGTRSDRHEPVHVADDVATFALGREHSCAVVTDGSVQCWGSNDDGQLGLGNHAARRKRPEPVPGLPMTMVRLASSTTAKHTCALTADGRVWCWGANDRGQLGDGTHQRRDVATAVERDVAGASFDGVTDLCASRSFTCARKSDGTMWCWGYDLSSRPVHLADDVATNGLACAPHHVCFAQQDGTVSCLGSNQHGQLGHDTDGAPSLTPLPVEGLDGVSFVNASETMSCATREDESTWCWGTDPGQPSGAPVFPAPLSLVPVEMGL
jgi:alpha-tubulin suppressor-like RCC1 family protein